MCITRIKENSVLIVAELGQKYEGNSVGYTIFSIYD
jgi:hypothetical protein